MSRIIALPQSSDSPLSTTQLLSIPAWHLAYASLWTEQAFNKHEIDRAVVFIRSHLDDTNFVTFCERILVARSQSLIEPSSYLPQPSIWLHPGYAEGYASTQSAHHKMQEKQLHIPGYQEDINAFAKFYYQYQRQPSKASFYSCRKKLLGLKSYSLLQLFYQVIAYNQYY